MVICKILLRELNNIRKVHEPENFLSGDNQRDLGEHEFEEIVNELLNKGFSAEYIRKNLISAMGLELSSLPPNVLNKLTGE